MTSADYKSKAVYEIENTNIHLYIDRNNDSYYCIAYDPDNYHIVNSCQFTERFPFFDVDNVAAKAMEIMQISCTDIRCISRNAQVDISAQEPDLKICILKAAADEACRQNYDREAVNKVFEIIKTL